MSLLAALFFPALCFVVTAYLFTWYQRRRKFVTYVDKFPGPPAVALFGNALQFKLDRVAFSYQLEQYVYRFARKSGIVRLWIGPHPLIILASAEAAEVVLNSNTLITKSSNYDIFLPWLGTGLLISTGDKWRTRRKLLTPTFHFSILSSFVDVFAEQARVLCDVLQPHAEKRTPIDIWAFIGRAALDIICLTAMGVSVDAQRSSDVQYVAAVQRMSRIAFKYERSPWLWPKLTWYLSGYGFEYDKCLKVLKGFTQKVIHDRSNELHKLAEQKGVRVEQLDPALSSTKRRVAFLDLLLLMRDENQLTLDDIREEVDTFMFEGHDTTASGMSWACFLLGHHPDVQEKCFEEMRGIFGESDRMPNAEDLKAMHYLDRVIKEALRLYPPVPLFARAATEDFMIGERTIPKGAEILILPMVIHRDPNAWGPTAEKFDPDRYVDEERRNPFTLVPFSAGARNCIGQKFALMEEKAVLSTIVRRFVIESVESIAAVRPLPEIIVKPPSRILRRSLPDFATMQL